MPNRVYLSNNDIIFHEYEGAQTYEIVMQNVKEIEALSKELRAQNKPIKVLGDYTRIGKADETSRHAAYEALKKVPYDKVALFGTSVFHRYAANFIILASGMGHKVKLFSKKEDALRWLMS